MDSDIGKNTDWISKLPDSLLCHILSFLPTKQSVATSVLSKRWQHLWTFVSTLKFSDFKLYDENTTEEEKEEFLVGFMNFVNRVLLLSDVMCLEKFCLNFSSFCNFDIADTWIATAIKRNVKTLWIEYNMEDISYIDDPIPLPQTVFKSKTLVFLHLTGNVLLDVRSPVWLPSLKLLRLWRIDYASDESVKKLLHGCPSLEELDIDMWVWQIPFTPNLYSISVPTLKRLSIDRLMDESSDDDFEDQFYKLEINAPALEHLYLSDYLTDEFSFADFPSLLTAYILIGPAQSTQARSNNPGSRISKVLSAIAKVKSLKFYCSESDYLVPTFPNLTSLRLGGSDGASAWNLNLLKGFLESSANLKVLLLQDNRAIGFNESLSLPPDVPHCLQFNLKKIVISKLEDKEYEFELTEYLLKNSRVLKKMTIDSQRSDSCLCSELAGYPRGSVKCKLNILL